MELDWVEYLKAVRDELCSRGHVVSLGTFAQVLPMRNLINRYFARGDSPALAAHKLAVLISNKGIHNL